jgi:hypothetical protein
MLQSHMKELMFIKQFMPDIYWSMEDEGQVIYIYAMDLLDPEMISRVKYVRW